MNQALPNGSAKQRSPKYASITLKEALEKIRKIYDSEHTHRVSREVVAKDLGYNTLNGASLPLIGSLKQYALLEDSGDGLKISEDAVAIIELPEDDPERREALKRIAFAPAAFKELRDDFGGNLPPSDANLRHHLVKKRFLPKAADEVIRIYRANLKLVGAVNIEYNGGEQMAINVDPPERTDMPYSDPALNAKDAILKRPGQQQSQQIAQISTPVGVEDGQAVFAHVRFDAPISKELVANLKRYLDYLETTLD